MPPGITRSANCVCVCVRMCVCAYVRACVCACMYGANYCLFGQHAAMCITTIHALALLRLGSKVSMNLHFVSDIHFCVCNRYPYASNTQSLPFCQSHTLHQHTCAAMISSSTTSTPPSHTLPSSLTVLLVAMAMAMATPTVPGVAAVHVHVHVVHVLEHEGINLWTIQLYIHSQV